MPAWARSAGTALGVSNRLSAYSTNRAFSSRRPRNRSVRTVYIAAVASAGSSKARPVSPFRPVGAKSHSASSAAR
jgi:hypothetical protein